MARVRLVHWKATEAEPLIALLNAAGHQVDYDGKFTSAMLRGIRTAPPDAVVIDLTRMPSHGRAVAFVLRQSPKTRHVPTVFVDGEEAKVALTRKVIPDATFTTRSKIKSAIASAMKNRAANPVVPPKLFSYHPRTAAQKMGIVKGSRIGVIDGPRDYERVIGAVPDGVEYVEGVQPDCNLLVWFFTDPDAYIEALPRMRALLARSTNKLRLWVLWKKGGTTRSGAVTQPLIREAGQEFGLVDYKICAVDKHWSGIALTLKRFRSAG